MRTGRDECENLCLPFIYRKSRKVSCMAFVYNLAGKGFQTSLAVESKKYNKTPLIGGVKKAIFAKPKNYWWVCPFPHFF